MLIEQTICLFQVLSILEIMKFSSWLSLRYNTFFIPQIIFRNLLTKIEFKIKYRPSLTKFEFYVINSNYLCESLRYKGAVS